MIVQGSLNYTTSGRRKKRNHAKRKKTEFRTLRRERKAFRKNERSYPSKLGKGPMETSERQLGPIDGITVSIPFNKGPYQVIPKSDIKYIGK